jgi:hypothetical protein
LRRWSWLRERRGRRPHRARSNPNPPALAGSNYRPSLASLAAAFFDSISQSRKLAPTPANVRSTSTWTKVVPSVNRRFVRGRDIKRIQWKVGGRFATRRRDSSNSCPAIAKGCDLSSLSRANCACSTPPAFYRLLAGSGRPYFSHKRFPGRGAPVRMLAILHAETSLAPTAMRMETLPSSKLLGLTRVMPDRSA